jgi:hypothetical protein
MFHWDKSIKAVNIPASKVVQLFRSMRDVQLALPGVAGQLASAFLCQYQQADGIATIAVFHLHKSRMLAFYCSDPKVVATQKVDSMLDQGLNFVESMGFLMTDQDLHLLERSDQEMLWASLPLAAGLQDEATVAAAPGPAKKPDVRSEDLNAKPGGEPAPQTQPAAAASAMPVKQARPDPVKTAPVKIVPETAPAEDVADNVDDLLAAVEAMRNKRPGLRARKSPPSAQEIAQRQLQLCQTVGRILASL